jgi:hypothetical protein
MLCSATLKIQGKHEANPVTFLAKSHNAHVIFQCMYEYIKLLNLLISINIYKPWLKVTVFWCRSKTCLSPDLLLSTGRSPKPP